jgi:hypothetical protein
VAHKHRKEQTQPFQALLLMGVVLEVLVVSRLALADQVVVVMQTHFLQVF